MNPLAWSFAAFAAARGLTAHQAQQVYSTVPNATMTPMGVWDTFEQFDKAIDAWRLENPNAG